MHIQPPWGMKARVKNTSSFTGSLALLLEGMCGWCTQWDSKQISCLSSENKANINSRFKKKNPVEKIS